MGAVKFGVGQPVKRVEDVRLVKGQGVFASDYTPPGALYAAFLRGRILTPGSR
jgi:aerobic carbon-monoxide dehydrogenase large subunit